MTVKKPVPCSIYDIRGIQEWLDEMALQGLFLTGVSLHFDRAIFYTGVPRPVRYRLDPIIKNRKNLNINEEHKELYAQMGWEYIDCAARRYNIFSCDNPDTPELYSDPQSLALALDNRAKRDIRLNLLVGLLALAVLFLDFFLPPGRTLQNLLLWEDPRDLVITGLFYIFLPIALLLMVFEVRRIIKTRNTLAQGLPLKAEKRRNRIPFWAWYIPFCCCAIFLPRLLLPSIGWEVQGLDEAVLSHPWPTAAQLEAVGPHPLAEEPEMDGYVRYNDSPFAPVQEFVDRYLSAGSGPDAPVFFPADIRYVQASSPRVARWIYRLELDEESKSLERRQHPPYANRVSELTPFIARDWTGLDRLEVAQYRYRGEDSWTFAVLRGNDVLLVGYTGLSRWEDCLPLFLEALDAV